MPHAQVLLGFIFLEQPWHELAASKRVGHRDLTADCAAFIIFCLFSCLFFSVAISPASSTRSDETPTVGTVGGIDFEKVGGVDNDLKVGVAVLVLPVLQNGWL